MSSHDKVMIKLKATLEVGHALKMRLMAKDGCEASILKELNNGVRKLEGVLVIKGPGQQPDFGGVAALCPRATGLLP